MNEKRINQESELKPPELPPRMKAKGYSSLVEENRKVAAPLRKQGIESPPLPPKPRKISDTNRPNIPVHETYSDESKVRQESPPLPPRSRHGFDATHTAFTFDKHQHTEKEAAVKEVHNGAHYKSLAPLHQTPTEYSFWEPLVGPPVPPPRAGHLSVPDKVGNAKGSNGRFPEELGGPPSVPPRHRASTEPCQTNNVKPKEFVERFCPERFSRSHACRKRVRRKCRDNSINKMYQNDIFNKCSCMAQYEAGEDQMGLDQDGFLQKYCSCSETYDDIITQNDYEQMDEADQTCDSKDVYELMGDIDRVGYSQCDGSKSTDLNDGNIGYLDCDHMRHVKITATGGNQSKYQNEDEDAISTADLAESLDRCVLRQNTRGLINGHVKGCRQGQGSAQFQSHAVPKENTKNRRRFESLTRKMSPLSETLAESGYLRMNVKSFEEGFLKTDDSLYDDVHIESRDEIYNYVTCVSGADRVNDLSKNIGKASKDLNCNVRW